jgi:hypothetical protein
MLDKDEIVNAMVGGQGVRQIARRHECSIEAVRGVLDEYAAEVLKPSNRIATMACDIVRLDTLLAHFMRRAIEETDTQAGTLCCKLLQRKAALLGFDQPATVRLDVQAVTEHEDGTSTERLLRALRRLRNDPGPESDADQEPAGKPN